MKIEKRTLPSQIQQIEKTREVQKILQALCDREDNDSSEKYIPTRFIPQKVLSKNRRTNHDTSSVQRLDLTDSSSENSSILSKRDKRSKSEKDQKMKSIRDSNDHSAQKVSRSHEQEKVSKKYNISSDSSDSTSSDSSSKMITRKHTSKRNVKSEKIAKCKTNSNRGYLSDSESDENEIRRASSISKRISKDTKQNKKVDDSYDAKRDKTKKYYDSTSESEDEEHKRRNTGKRSETSRTLHNSNDERKRDKLSIKSRPSNIQKDDSDDSSSKEFQKIKLQNMNRNTYSMRQLVDLEPTESSSVKNSASDKSEKNINEQSDQDFDDMKSILSDCKKICLNFQMYIENVEQQVLHNKEDNEKLILKSIEKINKLKTKLGEKQKNLTTSYHLWSRNRKRSATKRSYKVVSDDESLKEKRTVDKTKDISGDKQEYDKSNTKTQLTDENTNINDEQTSLNTDIHNDETEDSPLRDSCKKSILKNDGVNQSSQESIINESMDMFDTSFEDTEQNRTEVEIETNYDKEELPCTSKDKFSNSCKSSLQDKIPSEKKKSFLLSCDVREEKNQEKTEPSGTCEESDLKASLKTSSDDTESLDDAEALAKKALLATDSDTSDTLPNANVAKLTEDLTTNDTNRTEKENKMEDNDSDVNSVSTVMLSTFVNQTNTNVEKDTIVETETKVEKESNNQLNKRTRQDITSSDETEKAAKKALLESSSDDSIFLSSESGKITDKKFETDSSEKNARAKLSLLASSSESSNSELALSKTTNISKSTKHEFESDGESITAKLKKKRLKLDKNHHYNNDKKLKMSCKVHVTRLNAKILKCHSRALRKSREYLERKAFKSLINLDKLEKRRKKNTKKDSLTDDDSSSKILKNSNGKKKAKIKEESLMDYLERIENGNISSTVEKNSDTEESVPEISKIDDMAMSNEALISEADRIAKENLLNSSDSNEKEAMMDSDDSINNDNKDKTVENKKKKKKTEEKPEENTEQKTSKQDDSKKDKSDWRRDKILTMKFSDTDSETERKKWEKKQEKIANKSKENNSDSDNEERSFKSKKKKKIRRRILDSDSDIKITDLDSDSSSKASSVKQNLSGSESDSRKKKEKLKRKKHKYGDNSSDTDSSLAEKKPKPKRKRIKKMASDSDSSNEEIKNSQGSGHGKSGRKNIRKVLKDKQVAEDTKLAAKEEEERLKRIAERQTLYNEMYEMRLAGEEKVEKLVLDFDTETKEELVTVHEELVKRLKPHQAQGIKFMWDACFESVERTKNTSGSGCIIAHCMGLGKTLQVITLTHTLLTHEATNVKTVLVVCPLSTVLNWLNEYNTWLKDLDDFEVYELTKFKKNFERKRQLQRWQETGGVMIIGYAMFRNLTGPNRNIRKGMKEVILECLVDPGADLIICDEGHLLKNEDTALSKCMRRVKTMRRIVLTGTPLQNNLIEYHCMVQFVKPNLLGTRNEFLNRFVNPITNGQFDDSTAYDVKLMKKRAHVLHKMLEGCVQRFDYSVLTPFLPPKQEYVIFVKLTDTQIKMYQYYLQNFVRVSQKGTLFADFQALQRIWTHPVVLRLNAEKIEKANEKKELLSDSEGSLKDFINDSTDAENSSSSESSSDSDVQAIDDEKKDGSNVPKRRTRNNPGEEEPEEEIKEGNTEIQKEAEWWAQFVQPEHFEDIRVSAKLVLLFGILRECEQIGDKVLVFSQSLYSLTLIEEFLRRIDDQTQDGGLCETLDNHTGSWSLGLDYFRLDGQTSPENRNMWCKIFNRPTNTRARLFLISTRAGGLGINLTAANRVIIFDASWNPSHDVQSIFRIYRFGQKKPCYVYRFLAAGTMEEKIYNRQVTKLSLSCRVVDEQQIERHYSNHNLNELYAFEPYNDKEKPTLNLPTDRLLAEIFLKFKDFVENYHEHDSLLENKAEEELNEEERKQAWLEYEEEKKGKPLMTNLMTNTAYQNNLLLQQYMVNSNMMPQNMSLQLDYENFQQLIRKDYPNATPEQQKIMTNRAIIEMYNYWEKQATLYNNQPMQQIRNPVVMTNFQQRPRVPSNNQQVSQLNHLLSGQSTNYVNANKPVQPSDAQMRELVPNIFTYPNTPSANNISGNQNTDQNIMIPTTSNAGVIRQSGVSGTQVAAQPIDKSKIQEE